MVLFEEVHSSTKYESQLISRCFRIVESANMKRTHAAEGTFVSKSEKEKVVNSMISRTCFVFRRNYEMSNTQMSTNVSRYAFKS